MRSVIVNACIAAAMILAVCADTKEKEKLYIVFMDKSQMPSTFLTHHDWYKSVALSTMDLKQQADLDRKLVYTYNVAMHGFSALLTTAELEAVRALPAYVDSYEDRGGSVLHTEDLEQRWKDLKQRWDPKQRWEEVPTTRYGRRLQTTRSYKFLGLLENKGLWPESEFGHANDIIVGVLDSGIWPESLSFRDDGMGPVPSKWKGICQIGIKFDTEHCNKKLIGARYFTKGFFSLGMHVDPEHDYLSARDYAGHGTSTSSIVAGQDIPGANVDDFGFGTAKGMAPRVRVAMYKISWYNNFTGNFIADSDIVSAINQAIEDGVDIISGSFATMVATKSYTKDPVVYTSLNAVEKGVLMVSSAGNGGPRVSSVRNEAPWLLTVGATTIDRAFFAKIDLGYGVVSMKGTSLYAKQLITPNLVLLSGSRCERNSLDPKYVTGNILFCEDSTDVNVVTRVIEALTTGAIAVIVAYDGAVDISKDVYFMPVVFVNLNQSKAIAHYISSSKTPTARLQFHITVLDSKPAPMLGSFSGVGPSPMFPEIVKPDLVAPGINIIATCPNSRRGSECFRMSSGTSNAAPHVAGIAALLRAVHPYWSPAAIKSALMTTASKVDSTGHRIKSTNISAPPLTTLEIGCGHIKPELAVNPGLVYDIDYRDYGSYLCLTKQRKDPDCEDVTGSPYDLNLPTFAANFFFRTEVGEKQVRSFRRVLTYVGGRGIGTFKSYAYMFGGINVTVTPGTLVFKRLYQRLPFTLTMELSGPALVRDRILEGNLLWFDGSGEGIAHQVYSPLVAIFPDNY